MKWHSPAIIALFAFLFTVVSITPGIGLSNDRVVVVKVVLNFFDYLRDGDTPRILNSLTDPILTRRRDLLERNPNYPELLRQAYRDLETVKIGEIHSVNKDTVDVEVSLVTSNDSVQKKRFRLRKKDGLWKISEEIGFL